MRGRWITRLCGLAVGIAVVLVIAAKNSAQIHTVPSWQVWVGVIALGTGLVGLIAAPYIISYPYRFLRDYVVLKLMRVLRDSIRRTNVGDVVAGVIGLLIGLIIAALLTWPLSQLHFLALDQWLPTVVAIVAGLMGIAIAVWL